MSVCGVQERTVEQIVADFPVPLVAKELVVISKVFLKDRIQQRFSKQTIVTPGTSLTEKIVKGSFTHPQGKAQQGVNTHVQDVVTKISKQIVQKPIIQEKINQVTRHVDTPLLQIVKKIFEVPEL